MSLWSPGSSIDNDGAASDLRRVQADVDVGAERLGDLLGHELPDRLTGDSVDHLAKEVAIREGVITRQCARLPPPLHSRQQADDPLPIRQVIQPDGLAKTTQTGSVAQQEPDGQRILPPSGELGPIARHRSVHVELATIDQYLSGQGHHCLGRRPDVHQRVERPRPAGRGLAAPDVHGNPSVLHYGEARAVVTSQ
jgi:hypothetical protein